MKNQITSDEAQELIMGDEFYFEMSNISGKKTGLPFIVWVSPQTGKEKHFARIKIEYNNEMIPITISDNPEIKGSNTKLPSNVLKKAQEFVIKNKDILMDYWNNKITTDELIDKLEKV